MAHEMTANDRMFSVRVAPWHMGMGTNVTLLPDHPDPATVLVEAGLDWTVEEEEFYRKIVWVPSVDGAGDVKYEAVPGTRLLVRSDTSSILSVQKDSYAVVQNQVGAEIMDALLGDGNVKYETGGSTRDGAVCYLTARIDEDMSVQGDDSAIFPYLVVTWAHDGSAAMQARATNVRVVCQNTISLSEAEAERTGRRWTFRHTSRVHDRIAEARDTLRGVREEATAFQELANELAAISVSDVQREDFVQRFIPAPESTVVISDRVLDNINTARSKVRGLFDGTTIPEAHRNTAYGLLLAGTEYADHLRGARNSDTYLNRTLLREEKLKQALVPMIREVVAA